MNKEIEIWSDMPDFIGIYQISTFGNVKTLGRQPNRKEKIMKPQIGGRNYYSIGLTKNKKQKFFKIHQLVAMSFLNHIPNGNTIVINHVNGNKLDNRLINLELVTHRENSSTCHRINETNFSSKYVGVSWIKSREKWLSSIRINGNKKHIGYFDNEIEASNAYQNELNKII